MKVWFFTNALRDLWYGCLPLQQCVIFFLDSRVFDEKLLLLTAQVPLAAGSGHSFDSLWRGHWHTDGMCLRVECILFAKGCGAYGTFYNFILCCVQDVTQYMACNVVIGIDECFRELYNTCICFVCSATKHKGSFDCLSLCYWPLPIKLY
jgi:hypothetical protein